MISRILLMIQKWSLQNQERKKNDPNEPKKEWWLYKKGNKKTSKKCSLYVWLSVFYFAFIFFCFLFCFVSVPRPKTWFVFFSTKLWATNKEKVKARKMKHNEIRTEKKEWEEWILVLWKIDNDKDSHIFFEMWIWAEQWWWLLFKWIFFHCSLLWWLTLHYNSWKLKKNFFSKFKFMKSIHDSGRFVVWITNVSCSKNLKVKKNFKSICSCFDHLFFSGCSKVRKTNTKKIDWC